MTLEDFVSNFEAISDAPGGIQKLRDLTLDLALRGKVVPQIDCEEHSVEFLELEVLGTDARPYLIPSSWRWVQLGAVLDIHRGVAYPKNEASVAARPGLVALLRANNISDAGLSFDDLIYVPAKYVGERQRVGRHDIIVATASGSKNLVGKAAQALSDFDGTFGAFCGLLRIRPIIDPVYVARLLRSQLYRQFISRRSKGIGINNLRRDDIAEVPVPVPPLAEQKRIVAKVDQLMALCDDLEARQAKKRKTAVRLNRAALDALTSAEGPEEVAASFRRIAENFETLIHAPDSVEELRKVILELAIRSRIVQNPQADDIVDNSVAGAPFPVPRSWRWVPLSDLCERITKGSSPNWQGVQYSSQSDDSILFVTSENVGRGRMLLDNPKYVERRFNEIEPRSILRVGDLLMNIVGASIGRVAAFDRSVDANINQAVCLIRLAGAGESLEPEYVLRFLNSPTCIGYMFDRQVDSARANLSMGNIARFWVPVPPLAEQMRIVAKVDQLMALCDTLEAVLRRAESTAQKLAEAVVAEIVA